jgi:hypothetical protein
MKLTAVAVALAFALVYAVVGQEERAEIEPGAVTPQGWTRIRRAAKESTLELTIGLTQQVCAVQREYRDRSVSSASISCCPPFTFAHAFVVAHRTWIS